jgi:ABC-type antimicrobial peptide transport system permease subunit
MEILDAWQITSQLQTEPLALGLSGGFHLAFLVSWGLSAVGLAVYSILTARQRAVEFGVLRAVGLSSGQLLRQLFSEQAVLIVLALLAGSLLGPGLAQTMQPYLTLALPVLPGSRDPGTVARIVVDWAALSQMYLLLLLSLTIALAIMLWILSRLRLGRVLRLGE